MPKFKRPASSVSPAQRITATIIEKLEQGTKPWVKPWSGVPTSRPLRSCGTPYRGYEHVLAVDDGRGVRLRLALLDDLPPVRKTRRTGAKRREVEHRHLLQDL